MKYKIQELLSELKNPELKEQYTQLIFTLMEKGYYPGLAGVPVIKSSISHIDGKNGLLTYRGYPVQELAEHCSYEDVCFLLLNGDLPLHEERIGWQKELLENIDLDCSISKVITEMDKDLHPMYMLGASVLLLQAKDHKSFQVTNYNANLHRSLHLIAKLPSIIGVFMNDDTKFTKDKKFDSYAQYCLYVFNQKLAMETKWVKIFEKILILHADHTMNNSTFSVRAVGSSQASIYASIASAINSLSGPLHGGANESVMMMLKEIGSPDNVLNYVDNKLDNKEKIMGIGHRVYKTYDPRSLFIKNNILPLIFGQDSIIEVDNELKKLYDIAIKVEEVVIDRLAGKNIYPNVDFWSGLVLQAMGIEAKYFTTIFALGRIMGWVSHWVEHMEAKNRIFRPNQLYDGIGTRHIIIDSEEEIIPNQ